MSTLDVTATRVTPAVLDKPVHRRPKLAETWWRHVVGVIACLIALFPVWFVASAAFNRDQSVSGTSYVPVHFTLHNFGGLLHNQVKDTGSGSVVDTPFLRWLLNSIFVGLIAAFFTVLVAALAAYAFSRFRFKGRRFGMLALLLIQMFPGLLLVVALYLIVLNVGSIFPFLGINTFFALILVYLGGAMGVNTWLLKCFFDTIPKELY